jgi:ribose-phosphate pyrophosphokinase
VNCINVVVPFFWYSKGDKKDSYKRVPITAKLVTNLIRKAGANHVMIIDPHTPQMEGFFETPIDALKVSFLFSLMLSVCSLILIFFYL